MADERFEFPGYTLGEIKDTDTHNVEIGTLVHGDMSVEIHMIRNKSYPNLSFLPATIMINKAEGKFWTFKNEGWNGVARLAMAGTEPVVALCSRGRDMSVCETISLTEIVTNNRTLGVKAKLERKKLVAEDLGIPYIYNDAEQYMFDKIEGEERRLAREAAEKARVAAEEERKAEEERRVAQRAARRKVLMDRDRVEGYTADNRVRHGIPVVGNEWQVLDHDEYVIRVESYDGDTGTHGALIEAFRVSKMPGKNPQKAYAAVVHAEKNGVKVSMDASASTPKSAAPASTGRCLIPHEDDFKEVMLFGSIEAIRANRKAGLNGGTFVGIRKGPEQVEVYRVFADKMDTIGNFKPL